MDQPERTEGERGERTGRRSRRGGRRRRREPGESFGGEQRAEGGAPIEGGDAPEAPRAAAPAWAPPSSPSDGSAPAPAPAFEAPPPPVSGSFDFERVPERAIERPAAVTTPPAPPALPVVRPPHEVQEWTPLPPNDATRAEPRNEP
jgi:ribonuclease E